MRHVDVEARLAEYNEVIIDFFAESGIPQEFWPPVPIGVGQRSLEGES